MYNNILIDGKLRCVPEGYIKAETIFTKKELTLFDEAEGEKKKKIRKLVLARRKLFYEIYLSSGTLSDLVCCLQHSK